MARKTGGRVALGASVVQKLRAVQREAIKEKARDIYIQAREVMPTVHVLRDKGFSWREISEWLNARKMHWTLAALANEYRRWTASVKASKRKKRS